MHTDVSRTLARTRCLLVLLCVFLGVVVVHAAVADNSLLKTSLLFALADNMDSHAPASLEGSPSKRSGWQPGPIFEGIAKLHHHVGLLMFLFIAMMVVSQSLEERALLLVPIVLLYWGSKVLFAIDQSNMAADIMRRYKPK